VARAFFALVLAASGTLPSFEPFAATSACCSDESTLPARSASSLRRASIFSAHSTVWLSEARPSFSERVAWRSYCPTAM